MKKLVQTFPIISGILWGMSGIFVRVLGSWNIDTYTIVATRVIGASVMMLLGILLYKPSLLKIKLKDLPLFLFGGLVCMYGINIAYIAAIQYLTLSLAAVLISMSPVFVLVFASLFLHEPITAKKLFCLMLAISGCVLVSGVFESGSMNFTPWGIFLGILSALFYALYSLVSKKAIAIGYHPITMTFYCILLITIALLPITDWHKAVEVIAISPVSHGIFMFFHSLCTSVLSYVLYTISLNYMEAGRASILASCEPVAAMIFGALLFSETPTFLNILGLVFTSLALILLSTGKK